MTDDRTDLILRAIDDMGERLEGRIDELRDKVIAQNSRIGKLESACAVFDEKIDTIQERGCTCVGMLNTSAPPGSTSDSWWKPSKPLAQGGVGAGLVVALVELAKVAVSAWR